MGVEHGFTLEAIPISRRVAVDPRPLFSAHVLPPGVSVFATTSDAFFAQLEPDERFDLVFLDGLHTVEQTYRDLINSLRHLQPHGVIVIDDVVPVDAYSASATAASSEPSELDADFRTRSGTATFFGSSHC